MHASKRLAQHVFVCSVCVCGPCLTGPLWRPEADLSLHESRPGPAVRH